MPPVVVTLLGFPLMLALLVAVHLGVRSAGRRALGRGATTPMRLLLATTAGALAGYLACASFFLVAMLGHGSQERTLRVKVFSPGPAHDAGLRDGDRVLAINGERPESWNGLRAMVEDGAGGPIDVQVQRGAETLRFDVQPRDGRIGVASIVERHEIPLGLAAATAIAAPVYTLVTRARELTGPRTMMAPVAIVERDPSPWPYVFRLGELGAYAWPLSMLVSFAVPLLRRSEAP